MGAGRADCGFAVVMDGTPPPTATRAGLASRAFPSREDRGPPVARFRTRRSRRRWLTTEERGGRRVTLRDCSVETCFHPAATRPNAPKWGLAGLVAPDGSGLRPPGRHAPGQATDRGRRRDGGGPPVLFRLPATTRARGVDCREPPVGQPPPRPPGLFLAAAAGEADALLAILGWNRRSCWRRRPCSRADPAG